jgi:hypothetical protein
LNRTWPPTAKATTNSDCWMVGPPPDHRGSWLRGWLLVVADADHGNGQGKAAQIERLSYFLRVTDSPRCHTQLSSLH